MAEFNYPSINSVEVEDSEVIDFIKASYNPEDVFPESELESWAESNGFIKE